MEPNNVTNADGTATVKRYRHAGDLTGEPPTREVMIEIVLIRPNIWKFNLFII